MPSLLVISRTDAAHYYILAGLSTFVDSVVNIYHYSVCCTILSICSSVHPRSVSSPHVIAFTILFLVYREV